MKWLWRVPFGRYISDLQLVEGETVPQWYGIAWSLPYSHQYYCLPLPLNWLAGWARDLYRRAQRGPSDPIGEAYAYGQSKGFSSGYDTGVVHGLRMAKSVIREELS